MWKQKGCFYPDFSTHTSLDLQQKGGKFESKAILVDDCCFYHGLADATGQLVPLPLSVGWHAHPGGHLRHPRFGSLCDQELCEPRMWKLLFLFLLIWADESGTNIISSKRWHSFRSEVKDGARKEPKRDNEIIYAKENQPNQHFWNPIF